MSAPHAAAVLWDIDGTLIRTEPLHFQTVQDYCLDRGVALNSEDNAAMLGKTMPEKWLYLRETYNIHDTLDDFREACAESYRKGLPECPRRSGPLSIFHWAAEQGLSQACVSNGDRLVVEANIEALGIAPFIRFALCSDDFKHGKPDPEPYQTACNRLGLPAGSCLAIEDSPVGVASAARAGLLVAAWPDISGEAEAVNYSLAHHFVGGIEDFPLHLLGLEKVLFGEET